MKLANPEGHNAQLITTTFGADCMLGAVIARPTYRVRNGELVPAPDLAWPIGMKPVTTLLGDHPGDTPFLTGGVDVLVGGTVWQSRRERRPTLDVTLNVGRSWRRSYAVFGKRHWVKTIATLRPSRPEPFVSMPLRYERAFGGTAAMSPGMETPFPSNPRGRGYVLDDDSAVGTPLPNIEDPRNLVKTGGDAPDPVGLGYYPFDGTLRAQAAVRLDARDATATKMLQITPLIYNQAHPDMILPPGRGPRTGDVISLTNGLESGELRFTMPELAMHVHVQLEDRSYVFGAHLDQIGIVAGEGIVFFSLRSVFRYSLVPHERRQVTVYRGPVPPRVPDSYEVEWPDPWDPDWDFHEA